MVATTNDKSEAHTCATKSEENTKNQEPKVKSEEGKSEKKKPPGKKRVVKKEKNKQ